MIVNSNAKINIGLFIRDKRRDGYHNLESIFYPIPLFDILEIIPAEKESFSHSGFAINPLQNLILSAIDLIRVHYDIPNLAVHIHKQIPLGSGLGGGSSNAAFTLKLLNSLFGLNISKVQLLSYALELGSDCPFFIENKPALIKGRGELIHPISPSLKGKYLKLVYPEIHSSTKIAFESLIPVERATGISTDILEKNWTAYLINDFETGLFEAHPNLRSIKTQLINEGAEYVSLTGTGSSIYGLFDTKPKHSSQKNTWVLEL